MEKENLVKIDFTIVSNLCFCEINEIILNTNRTTTENCRQKTMPLSSFLLNKI